MVRMAANSNSGFHRRTAPSSVYNHHMVSFQSGAASGSTRMLSAGVDRFVGMSSPAGTVFTENTGGIIDSSCVHLDPAVVLMDTVGLALHWSSEEQATLEEGLVKYANEPNITRYIKIAVTLQNKSVRDVALRCRWMTTKKGCGRWRKKEEFYVGNKMKGKKEKQVESSSSTNLVSSQLPVLATSHVMCTMNSTDGIPCEAPVLDGAVRHLLEKNAQVLSDIIVNLEASKLRDNIDLFFHVKNNVGSVLKRMKEMPGTMSQMPPLPVSINEDLMNVILPHTSKALMLDMSSSIHLKQEPRCRLPKQVVSPASFFS